VTGTRVPRGVDDRTVQWQGGARIERRQPVSVDIPNPIGVNLDIIGPVDLGPVTLAGIPDTFHIDVTHLPQLEIKLDKVQLAVDPVSVSVAITEIPRVRAHVPAHFTVGLKLFGMEVLCIDLCGEAQVITEPYHPNPAERCGPTAITVTPVNPVGTRVGVAPPAAREG
jgi:hypothetical protein